MRNATSSSGVSVRSAPSGRPALQALPFPSRLTVKTSSLKSTSAQFVRLPIGGRNQGRRVNSNSVSESGNSTTIPAANVPPYPVNGPPLDVEPRYE